MPEGDQHGSNSGPGSPGWHATEAERLLWAAYPIGAEVNLGEGVPEAGDTDREVRADVISGLLLGACESRPGRVPAVRLKGARITGCLNISGGTVACELLLENCRLDKAPDFSNAQTRQVRFKVCHMPGFDGGGLRTDGYLSLSGCVFEGQVKLVRAQLTGGFRMNRTRITAEDNWALYAGALTVEAGTFGRGAVITGGVRLTGARMGGGLFLEGATLKAGTHEALTADNMVVEDAMECGRGFVAEGSVRLRGVRVNGTLSFNQSILRCPGKNRSGNRRALHLSHAQIDELILGFAEPVEGEVTLVHSKVGVLMDWPESWPEKLRLNGLSYDSLRGAPDESRLGWVARDPHGFHPQPYEELALWYRRAGREDLARKTQLAKQRARRRTMNWPGRVGGLVLDWTVGYGYRPWIAGVWIMILLLVGTVTFSLKNPSSLRDPGERPDFNAFIYTLDLLVPVGMFGQRGAWEATGWTAWVAYGLIVTGWLLATALIAGVTRVLRPN